MFFNETMDLTYIKGESLNEFITNNLSSILQEWNRTSEKAKFFQSAKATPNSLRESFEHLFLIIGEDMPGIDERVLVEWAQEIGRIRAQQDFPIHYSLELFNEFRRIFWKTLQFYLQESKANLQAEDVFAYERYYNRAIDMVIDHFASNYVDQKNELIRFQQITMEVLSVPMIPLSDDACLLNIAGTLDHTRANKMMDQTFEYVSQMRMKHLILDITAAHFVESKAVEDVVKLIQGLKLLGCDAVLTGIRPEVVKIMVQQGFDIVERVASKPTIKEAIESLALLDPQEKASHGPESAGQRRKIGQKGIRRTVMKKAPRS